MSMRSWIRNLFNHPISRTIRKAHLRGCPNLEKLEDRWVPSTIVVNNMDGSYLTWPPAGRSPRPRA